MLETIGKGGFSTVYKCSKMTSKNELFAVKKITLNLKKQTKKTKEEVESALREILILEKLNHENVVQYNTSWIEAVISENATKEKKKYEMKYKKEKVDNSDEENSFLSYDDLCGDSDISFVLFCEEETSMNNLKFQEDEVSGKEKKKRKRAMTIKEENIPEEKVAISGKTYNLSEIQKLTIYIEMELCQRTLSDYIVQLSNSFNSDLKNRLELFIQTLKGVEYIHSTQLIHRDIKPSNIFLTSECEVKIGDFGLATDCCKINYTDKNSPNLNMERKNSIFSNCSASTEHSQFSYHTKNIGTKQYASPEQLSNNFYDQKSDIYSLGLILFEMIHPLKTGMEKHQKSLELRKGKIPNSLLESQPQLSELILSMVSENPSNRPCSTEIISLIQTLIL